jgi:hypothetical protein
MATPTPEQVTARLRLAADLSGTPLPRGIDDSREAITARLRELSDVSALCMRLVEIGKAARARSAR